MLRGRAVRKVLAELQQARQFAELRAAAAARLQARQFAEYRAAAESGQWFLIDGYASPWLDNGYNQQVRMVCWGRLKAQHPANWWEYDMIKSHPLEWLDYRADGQTRPYPQPATTPQPVSARNYWSDQVPVPPAAPPVQLTASQNQAQNANGSTARNLARNKGGNAF